MPGRHPTPTHLKILKGNPGKRALPKGEPKPTGDLKAAPEHLDEDAKAVWDYAIANAPQGLLKMIDAGVLEIWCQAQVVHRKAAAQVRQFGVLVKPAKADVPIQSPWMPVMNKQALIMLRAVDHLGFSPASRTRISLGDGAPSCGAWDDVENVG